ncbi:FAD-dependent oxidoreductase [Natronorubrum sp. FCH18a]|uniref:FAD-dependent oxidoreductase n=1 Tax=Natronorubrum sp. FCH18a TaxID=3447018 RepID=UPI003F51545B
MIGVVGGNLTGLAAASRLLQCGHEVRVFEPSGELASTVTTTTTTLETAAGDRLERVPVSFVRPRDEAALELLAELGLAERLEWTPIRTAIYFDGTVHPVDTPWEFLAYPPLSLSDTAKLASVQSGIDARDFPRRRPRIDADDSSAFADVPAERFVRERASDAVYDAFYGPLLEARFGSAAPEVSASWVLEHCRGDRERTRLGREKRGYLAGSTAVLVDALADSIGRERILTNARVTSLECANGRVESLTVDGDGGTEGHAVDAVVLATDPDRLEPLTGVRPSTTVRTRTCLRVSTTAETPLTDVYRVTMADDAPFGELVTHTALRSPDHYGGHQYSLLDGGEAAAAGRSDAAIEREWLEALTERFAGFDRNDLVDVELTQFQQPVPERGTASLLDPTPTELSATVAVGVYDAGLTRQPQFPERHVGGALEAGLRCGTDVADATQQRSTQSPRSN